LQVGSPLSSSRQVVPPSSDFHRPLAALKRTEGSLSSNIPRARSYMAAYTTCGFVWSMRTSMQPVRSSTKWTRSQLVPPSVVR